MIEVFIWSWQILLLLIVIFGWVFMHNTLKQRYGEKYGSLPRKKQIYIVKNIVKSVLLCSISPLALYGISRVLLYGIYDSNLFRIFGCVYASSDIVGLIVMNRNLAKSTLFHHVCVVAFCTKSIYMDYANPENEPFRQISMLGAFSALTWPVNTHLGLRTLLNETKEYKLRMLSLCIYLPMVAISFAWQACHAFPFVEWDESLLYIVAILLIFYDDCVLLSFLSRNENQAALFLYTALIIPATLNWNTGNYNTAVLEFTTMVLGLGSVCFSNPVIGLSSFFAGVTNASFGLTHEPSWYVFLTKSYVLLSIVILQLIIQGHKIIGRFLRRRPYGRLRRIYSFREFS